jgi:tRNA pseudouridine32 synthase / 23S rRNA pseudouridine746 synthase
MAPNKLGSSLAGSATPPALLARDGVGPSCVTVPAAAPTAVLDFLVQRFARIDPAVWLDRIAAGTVLDRAGRALNAASNCKTGDKIYYWRSVAAEPRVPFEEAIVYETEHIVVADKPHFLPVTPTGRYVQESLLVRLKNRLNINDLAPMHRIDRDTAGLVMFSKQIATRGAYAALFREHKACKVYEAIAPYRADLALPLVHKSRMDDAAHFMQMREIDGEPNSETRIALMEQQGSKARYQLEPITGRRHQLRLHMTALGIPIVGDQMYPTLTPECAPDDLDYSQPLQLLAKHLEWLDPLSGKLVTVSSRLALSF